MDIKELTLDYLRGLGCVVTHDVDTDIVIVTTPEGVDWDFTVPMERT
jgi:hypothetical protein